MNIEPTPIRIAHVTGERGFSGGEVQVFLLMEGLRSRGYRNVLICPPSSESAREAEKRGFDVHCVRMRNDASLVGAMRVRSALVHNRPDLVHLHTGRANWLGGLAAWQLSLPAITTRRMDRRVGRGLGNRFLYRRVLHRAVAISPAVRDQLIAAHVPERNIRVIRSAVDPNTLQPSVGRNALRNAEGLDGGTPCLLVLASLVRRKGIDVLLDALAEASGEGRNAVLWIAGDGPERAALERRASELGFGARVRFLGRRDDAPDLLAACDVFVLPSRREGLGVAALEAMAAARPIVATDVGGLGETVVHERTGLLVPPEDPGALGAAIDRLIGDPSLRERLGAAGPARLQEGFTANQMVDAYADLYQEVLAERSRS